MKRVIVFIVFVSVGYFAGTIVRSHSRQNAIAESPKRIVKAPPPASEQKIAPKQESEERRVLVSKIKARDAGLKERAQAVAQEAINKRKKDYESLFSALGVDAKTASQLIHHIGKIYKAKAEVANDMYLLQSTKQDYDERIEKLTGTRYAEYRAYEDRYLATVEAANLRSAADAIKIKVPESELTAITDLIQQNQALTFNSFADMGTPYGDVMPPIIGKEFAPGLQKHVTRLGAQVPRIVEQAKKNGMSDGSIQAIQNYYATELDRYLQLIEQYSPKPKN